LRMRELFCCSMYLANSKHWRVGLSVLFFFFFQAEDGIRDRNVTGVQTCALPISPTYSVLVPAANSGYMEYVGGKLSILRPGPPKACRICCRTSFEPLAAQMWSWVSSCPK